jgi:hypothetical protein
VVDAIFEDPPAPYGLHGVGPFDPSNPNFPLYLKMLQGSKDSGHRGGRCSSCCGCIAIAVVAIVLLIPFCSDSGTLVWQASRDCARTHHEIIGFKKKDFNLPKIVDASVWIGQTKEKAIYKVYVVGKKPRGKIKVWVLGSSEARDEGLKGFPEQEPGFSTPEAALAFAKRAFPHAGKLAEFISHDLNPAPEHRADAPVLLTAVELQ